MRCDREYLNDIVEAVDAVSRFVQETTSEEFPGNLLVPSAIAVKLTNIGEAAACISDDLRKRHPEVDWSAAIEVGTAVLERYYDVDWHKIWSVATTDAPVLREQVARILAEEFSDSGTDD